jgi:photosystem II oxygen-evolving enhancer protein 2
MRRWLAVLCAALLSFTLQGCVAAGSGLQAYVDSIDGYEFLYPTGWIPLEDAKGADVVFRDLIQNTENVSVVMSSVDRQQSLADLGDPSTVGQRLGKAILAPPDSGRQAEMLSASERQVRDKTYYDFEYLIQLPGQERHNLASVAVSRGKLYTLSVSAQEQRWTKVQDLFHEVVNSFRVY